MTMGVRITHFNGNTYKAKIEIAGQADVVLSLGECHEAWIHSDLDIKISEISNEIEEKN